MNGVFVKWAALLLSLSLLIVLHEAGHFIAAKSFKTRVSKFYLFFDFLFPVSGWLNFSLLKFKRGETEYGIGWFPLGGYVQIEGMVDEQMDSDKLNAAPEPWEFRSKPTWQRLIIMAGGIIVNVLLGFFIYMMILWCWGEQTLPVSSLKDGITAGSIAKQIGFQDGDQLLQLDHHEIEDFSMINKALILHDVHTVQISRAGREQDIVLPADIKSRLIKSKGRNFIGPRIPAITGSITPGSPAALAGLQSGDQVLAANGQPVTYYHLMQDYLETQKNKDVQLEVKRNGENKKLLLHIPADNITGIQAARLEDVLVYNVHNYTLPQAISNGFRKGVTTISDYLLQLKILFSGQVNLSESLGGFGSFAGLFPSQWDWKSFWHITAFLSFVLAIMNLLPVPGLDGGHIVFVLYEMFSGRKPAIKVMEYAQMAGMIILFSLMLYSNGLDIWRALKSAL